MKKEKYLIFGQKLATEDIANQDATVQTTTSLVNAVSLLNATSGTDGIIEVQLLKHADHTAGSAYTTTNGEYFTINSSGYTVGASNGVITIIPATGGGNDAVNGVTLSGTNGNNDFRVNLLKHIDGGVSSPCRLVCFPASNFVGIQTVSTTRTDICFKSGSGDLGKNFQLDIIEVTHPAGNYKELAEMVSDAIAPAKSGAPVDFFIGGNSGATGTTIDNVVFNGNPAGITAINIALDS